MQCAWSRQPSISQRDESFPIDPMFLTATSQATKPLPDHLIPKLHQAFEIVGYCVIVEVALHDRPEPFPRFHHRMVHPLPQLLFNLLQLGAHALRDRLTAHNKMSLLVFPAYMREPQKVERLRLSCSSPLPVLLGK